MGFLLDGITISLCLLTVGYCYFLNRQIKGLRHSKSGIGNAIEQMNKCIGDLQGSFIQAKQAVEKQSEILHDRLDEGGSLADHMGVLVRQANRAIVAIESGLARSTKAKEEMVHERKKIESLLKDSGRVSAQAQADALLHTFFQKGTSALTMAAELEATQVPATPTALKTLTPQDQETHDRDFSLSRKAAVEALEASHVASKNIAALMEEFPLIQEQNSPLDPLEDVVPKGLQRLVRGAS